MQARPRWISITIAEGSWCIRRHGDAWLWPLAEPLGLLLSYARDMLRVEIEPFVARIVTTDARSIALFAALGIGVALTVALFVEVEMRIVGLGYISWPAGRVGEYP